MIFAAKMKQIVFFTLSFSLVSVVGAINTEVASQKARGSAFNNIISNYFTTDPFFKAKQKLRLHLPSSRVKPVKKTMLMPANAKQDRMSSISRSSPTPESIRVKLGPPIQILPNLSSKTPAPRPHPTHGMKRKTSGGDIVVGQRNDHQVVVPAPLLAASGANLNKPLENNLRDNKDKSSDNGRRQSFSQLISTSDKVQPNVMLLHQ